MFVFFATSIDQTQTMQSSVNAILALKLALTIIFILTFLVGLANLLFYLMIKHSPDLTFNFLVPKLHFGKKNIKFSIEDNLGRPLGFTRLTVFQNEKIYKVYYFFKSKFAIHLPKGDFQVTVSKFGHSAGVTDTFRVADNKLDFDLSLNKTQEIRCVKSIVALGNVTLIANAAISLIWLITLSTTYTSTTLAIQIVIIALIVFSAYLGYQLTQMLKGIELVNFKNRPLAKKKVEITNKLGETVDNLKSDEKGRFFVIISPGIYKFAPVDHIHRAVRVNETSLGHFRIKF